ncbi:MAG: ParB/RepB/Spo0J family partition protein [Acholeplasmataceae bacterium]
MKDDKKARTLGDLFIEHHVDELLEGEVIEDISLDVIRSNPFQPRKIFDQEKINELAQSIKEHGVFQPIILKKVKDGYIIVSGERRYRASKQVGLRKIPAIIRQYEESKVAEIALAENLQRENLTAIEEAEAYLSIIDKLNLTQAALATKVGKSRSHITNILGLLNLPKDVQEMLLNDQISMGHARAISKLDSHQAMQKAARSVLDSNLSVREIEDITRNEKKRVSVSQSKKKKFSKEEKMLKTFFNKKVSVTQSKVTFYIEDEDVSQFVNRLIGKNQ